MKWLSLFACALVVAAATSAQEYPHGEEYREVGEALMCQCGCNQTIAACAMDRCHSAEPIREEIWERLQNGESVASVIEVFKERYGLVILSAPPATGFHLTAWVLPFLALVVGAIVVWQVLRSWTRSSEASAAAAGGVTSISDTDRARIERELRDLT